MSTSLPSSAEVLSWEQQRRDALLAGDATTLQSLLSEALVYVHSTAVRDTRDSYVGTVRDGVLRYLTLSFDDLQVQVTPGAALVTGQMRATVVKDGQEKAVRSLFLTVWTPESNGVPARWRLRAHQGTPLPL